MTIQFSSCAEIQKGFHRSSSCYKRNMNLLVLKNSCLHECQYLTEVTSGQAVPSTHRHTDIPVMVQSKICGSLPANCKDKNSWRCKRPWHVYIPLNPLHHMGHGGAGCLHFKERQRDFDVADTNLLAWSYARVKLKPTQCLINPQIRPSWLFAVFQPINRLSGMTVQEDHYSLTRIKLDELSSTSNVTFVPPEVSVNAVLTTFSTGNTKQLSAKLLAFSSRREYTHQNALQLYTWRYLLISSGFSVIKRLATVFATFQFENEYVDNDINVQLENMKVKMERVSVYVAGGTVYVLMLCEEPEGSK
ncbi:hypothetical protein Anapl_12549 [Anas platyrhynchos]|uniref:Uncharacterized protein n=1 Tax=Anas platyrhynchos TaxID=8839 RepID=R0LB49_ANAPL|nr:hypothetical protein Anapl_12549 [Anas platyrhynchos]